MRICSLIPSATEMVFALGMGHRLAGVSHECDFPAGATQLPKVTRSKIPPGLSSSEIDRAVSSALETSGSLYDLDLELLESLQPDLILTQSLCDVCAVSYDLVQEAVKAFPSKPEVLNLDPHSLEEILEGIRTLGNALGCEAAAETLVSQLEARIDAVRRKTKDLATRPRVLCMEWVNPPYCGGHWMKELVEIAGGRDDLSNHHRPSYRIEWSRVLDFSPEVIVLTCCGFSLERCRQEGEILAGFEGIGELPAARAGRIFATDGSSYFSRSGPRIVESLEILAHLIHPERFAPPPLAGAFVPVRISPVAAIRA
jgi:iron complex transport system substrate-binding protein